MAGLIKTGFTELEGWAEEDHKAAFAAFRHSSSYLLQSPPTSREKSARAQDLLLIAQKAFDCSQDLNAQQARCFFEDNFQPYQLQQHGLLTGYYQPQFEGRRTPDADFCHPLYKRPGDLIPISSKQALAAGFTKETSFARETEQGLAFHLSRSEIMAGGLDGLGLELVWLKDPLDVYIIHIQGSARIVLEDETILRVAFDGKSGHPYQSLGKILIKKGIFSADTITMDGLMAYIKALGDAGSKLLAENPSYIFFKQVQSDGNKLVQDPDQGPVAAAGIPLVAMRSMAVDRHRHTFGLPFWLQTNLPSGENEQTPFNQLVFAHDTGSAITGAARGDLFVGTGAQAGQLAGRLQQQTAFFCLMPIKRTENAEGS
ncbi:murein transglycosylase A [Cohaesibacter celericrescens]|uniref:murein transglycosylase A n=1 Tax=Cohaesibacter celericrescens TaxID=2067669 RepID=UPI00356505AC